MKQLEVPREFKGPIVEYFKTHKVSVSEVRKVMEALQFTGKLNNSVKI